MRYLLALALAGCRFSPAALTVDSAAAGDAEPGDASADAAGADAIELDAPADTLPPPPIAFRQVNAAEAMSSAEATVPFLQPQLAGDLNVVFVGWYKPGTFVSVSDTNNNAYTVAAPLTTTGNSTYEYQVVYYACGIAAALAGANTVRVRFQGADQDPDVRIVEYTGIRPSACLDQAHSATGAGASINSGTLTTTQAHDLLVAGNKVYYQTSAGDPSYKVRTTTGFGDLVEDRIVAAPGMYAADATENMPGAWVMQLVAFRGF